MLFISAPNMGHDIITALVAILLVWALLGFRPQ